MVHGSGGDDADLSMTTDVREQKMPISVE